MTLPVQQFQILSPEQANPFLTQFGNMSKAYGQMLQNQQQAAQNRYLQPQLEQQLQSATLQNRILGAQSQIADQVAKAGLNKTLADIQEISQKAGLEHSQSGYYSAETQQSLINAAKAGQMLGIIQNAYYGDQGQPANINAVNKTLTAAGNMPLTLGQNQISRLQAIFPGKVTPQPSAQLSGQQQPQNIPPQTQSVSTQQPFAQAQNANVVMPQQTLPGVNLSPQQQGLSRLSDVMAATQGKSLPGIQQQIELAKPSIEQQAKANYAYGNAINTSQAKSMQEMANNFATQSSQAIINNQQLAELNKATNDTQLKGRWAALAPEVAMWQPNYAVAMKAQMQLQLSQIKGLAGSGLGKILEREVDMIGQGTPSPNLPPEAIKILSQQMKIANDAVIQKANLFNKYKDYIQDPARLGQALNSVTMANNPVDENGNIDESKIKAMDTYATPQLMAAESDPFGFAQRNGVNPADSNAVNNFLNGIRNDAHTKAYPLPKGVSEDDMNYMMSKKGLTRGKVMDLLAARGIK